MAPRANIFVTTANNKEAEEIYFLEDLDMESIKTEVAQDDQYLQIVEAMKQGVHTKYLPVAHPARQWVGLYNLISLEDQDKNSRIIIDGQKIIMPKGLQL